MYILLSSLNKTAEDKIKMFLLNLHKRNPIRVFLMKRVVYSTKLKIECACEAFIYSF